MKKLLNPFWLPAAVLLLGEVGLVLRVWLLAAGTEYGGMLPESHPAEPLLWMLTAAALALLLVGTSRLLEGSKFQFNFPASLTRALGCGAGCISIAVTSALELSLYQDTLNILACSLGFAAAAAVGYIAWCRYKGMQPVMLFHAIAALYLMLRLVSQYRHWSSDPQLMDYCFQLLATVCLMLACYQRAAFDAGCGDRRAYTLFHLAAVFFCCLSLVSRESIAFYLGTGIWMLCDLCNLAPMPRKERT